TPCLTDVAATAGSERSATAGATRASESSRSTIGRGRIITPGYRPRIAVLEWIRTFFSTKSEHDTPTQHLVPRSVGATTYSDRRSWFRVRSPRPRRQEGTRWKSGTAPQR